MNSLYQVENVDFLSVAGDNYYAEKAVGEDGKKFKIFHEREFRSGYGCMLSQNKIRSKYVLLGNHDMDVSVLPVRKQKKQMFPSCNSFHGQQSMSEQYKSQFQLVTRPLLRTQGDTAILMLDTVLFDTKIYAEGGGECYFELEPLSEPTPISVMIKNRMKKQEEILLDLVNSLDTEIRNLIIIGHHVSIRCYFLLSAHS
jgi:hypothetical protein